MNVELRKVWAESKPREQRLAVSGLQVRESETGSGLDFAGYASVTGEAAAYDVRDFLGEYTETIRPGAFTRSLNAKDDVRLLVNHDGVPLARTKSQTLTLREITDPKADPQERGQTGLWCEASLDGASPLVQTVRSAMARGDLDQMSFAFQATRQEWNEDYTQRTITEAKLFDVSVVTYPASPTTSAALRDGRKDAAVRLADVISEARAGRVLSAANVDLLSSILSQLADGDAALDPIVDALVRTDEALDAAQAGISGLLGVANPDEPEDDAADRSLALRRARMRADQAFRKTA